jgi:hypothetical protein
MTNDQVFADSDLGVGLCIAKNGTEDHVKLVGLLPQGSSGLARRGVRSDDHPKVVLGFAGFLFAVADLTPKLLPGNGFICLAVVGTHACATADELANERRRNDISRNRLAKIDDRFSETGGSFRQVVRWTRVTAFCTTGLIHDRPPVHWSLDIGQWSLRVDETSSRTADRSI